MLKFGFINARDSSSNGRAISGVPGFGVGAWVASTNGLGVQTLKRNNRIPSYSGRKWPAQGWFGVRILKVFGCVEINMDTQSRSDAHGHFDARYLGFLETITQLRPRLHRYCSRMSGSVLDGEDVVQDALFQAYRKLDKFDDSRPLAPWLFRIAHNRCIDFLRRRGVRKSAEAVAAGPDFFVPVDRPGPGLGRAVEHLVLNLPPKERACVLLKDVLDHSLEETAELVGSTLGGVKAALKRGRRKLATMPEHLTRPRTNNAETAQLLRLYLERCNRRDWDGVRELISADARLHVTDRFLGELGDSLYFGNHERWTVQWRMAGGELDGKPVIIRLQQDQGEWTPKSVVRLDVFDRQIVGIVDYGHCPWVLPAAASVIVSQA
jgi:RNA polymerase sigma-70 factor, ECF subfamily